MGWNFQHRHAVDRVLAAYMAGVVLLATLAPFNFRIPEAFRLDPLWTPLDLWGNVLFFLPVGFVLRPLLHRPQDRWALGVALAGFALSSLCEIGQMFLPLRFPALHDVLMNGLGAWLGALLWDRIGARRLDVPALPVLGPLVLAVPLMWLDATTSGRYPGRIWLLASYGLFGAVLWSALWQARLPAPLSRGRLIVLATGWFALGAAPGMRLEAPAVLAQVGAVAAATTLLSAWPMHLPDRRVEGPALRRALPVAVFAVSVSYLWPLSAYEPPTFAWGMPSMSAFNIRITILELLTYLAGFTLLGHTVAGIRSRRSGGVPLAGAGGLLLAMVLELGHAAQAGRFGELPRPLLAAGAALGGAALHRRAVLAWQADRDGA